MLREVRVLGAMAAAVSLLSWPASAQDDAAARKARAVHSRTVETTRPVASTHPDADLRKSLEQDGRPTSPPGPATPADATAPPEPHALAALEQQHDWAGDLARGGPAVAGLRLALGASPGPYVVGTSYYLYLGISNRGAGSRTLAELPACGGSFGRAEGVVFRVVADGADEVMVPLAFKDTDEEHPHAPLELGANDSHRALVDLTHLSATSANLAELLLGASRVVITAEVPTLGLVSNPVGIDVEVR